MEATGVRHSYPDTFTSRPHRRGLGSNHVPTFLRTPAQHRRAYRERWGDPSGASPEHVGSVGNQRRLPKAGPPHVAGDAGLANRAIRQAPAAGDFSVPGPKTNAPATAFSAGHDSRLGTPLTLTDKAARQGRPLSCLGEGGPRDG